MKRVQSLSNYGMALDRKTNFKNNPQFYEKILAKRKEHPLKVQQLSHKIVQGFDKISGRQKLNSFQSYNTKEYNCQSSYEGKTEMIKTRNVFYLSRKEEEPRLTRYLKTQEVYHPQQKNQTCLKFKDSGRNGKILTSRDLQNQRKENHHIDFNKQNDRPYSYIKKTEGRQASSYLKSCQREENLPQKSISTHSFTSYTKRQLFSQKRLIAGAPPESGSEYFKIIPSKYKKNWKSSSAITFQKMSNHQITRFDRDGDQWNTKLNYHPKEEIIKKKVPAFKINLQKPRQLNQVHSKYPIRISC